MDRGRRRVEEDGEFKTKRSATDASVAHTPMADLARRT